MEVDIVRNVLDYTGLYRQRRGYQSRRIPLTREGWRLLQQSELTRNIIIEAVACRGDILFDGAKIRIFRDPHVAEAIRQWDLAP